MKPAAKKVPPARPTNISIVAPMLVERDAISRAAIDTGRAVALSFGVKPRFFTYCCELPGVEFTLVRSVDDLLANPAFQDSDIVIYHFGVYADVIDAVMIGAPGALQVMRFHNVTSRELVPESDWFVIDQSWQQVHLLRDADLVWADSLVNAGIATDHDVDPQRIEVIPLAIEFPKKGLLATKPRDVFELIFVGRIVPSKGVIDLLESIERLAAEPNVGPLKARIVGTTRWSSPEYLRTVRETIITRGLDPIVELVGDADATSLAEHYARAHVFVLPSYHEGFCVPAIEALRGGCLPVTYDAHNLRHIAGGHGRTVPTGQPLALAKALLDVLDGLRQDEARTDAGTRPLRTHDKAVADYVEQFSFAAFADQTHESLQSLWQGLSAGRVDTRARETSR